MLRIPYRMNLYVWKVEHFIQIYWLVWPCVSNALFSVSTEIMVICNCIFCQQNVCKQSQIFTMIHSKKGISFLYHNYKKWIVIIFWPRNTDLALFITFSLQKPSYPPQIIYFLSIYTTMKRFIQQRKRRDIGISLCIITLK